MADPTAKKRKKKKSDDEPDVIGHIAFDPVDPYGDDPERKRKRKRKNSDAPESDELGRKRK